MTSWAAREAQVTRQRAILLLGPTGSGKTLLGDHLQQRGLWGRACHHFDFGQALRRAARGESGPLGSAQVAYVRRVLESGELLDDEHFVVAEAILQDFIRSRDPHPDDLLILNGLPRHSGQAEALASAVDVEAIVRLCCPPEIAAERIARNSGGDRSGRADDEPSAVRARLARFESETAPLVEWYRRRGATVRDFAVTVTTSPADVAAALDADPLQR